jgi:hypothetical protein
VCQDGTPDFTSSGFGSISVHSSDPVPPIAHQRGIGKNPAARDIADSIYERGEAMRKGKCTSSCLVTWWLLLGLAEPGRLPDPVFLLSAEDGIQT